MFQFSRLGDDTAAWYDLKAQFLSYWNQLKSFITSLTNLDTTIMQQNSRLQVAKQNAATPAQLAAIQQAIDRNVSYYNLWADIKNNIDTYLPEWLQAQSNAAAGPPAVQVNQATQDLSPEEQESTVMTTTGSPGSTTTTTTTMQGLGLVPLILISAAALAALAYVTVKGLELLKQVNAENSVISGLEKGLLTTQQASALLPYGVSSGPSASSALGFGTLLIVAIPVIVGLMLFKTRS